MTMSRFEALMVALGMILLGLAAASADRPGLQPVVAASTVQAPEPTALSIPDATIGRQPPT